MRHAFGSALFVLGLAGCTTADVIAKRPDAGTDRSSPNPNPNPDPNPGPTSDSGTNPNPNPTPDASPTKPNPDAAPPPGSCGLPGAAFCDTFSVASRGESAGDNGGALDDGEWSVARLSDFENPGQGQLNTIPEAAYLGCGKSVGTGQANTVPGMGVLAPDDFFLCAGGGTQQMHLNTAFDDLGQPVLQSFRVRRPFDFANRTGIIAFDVDGQAQAPSGHGYWLNVFISAEPVPAPYQDIGIGALYAKDGVAVEFEATPAPCGSDGTKSGVSNFFVQKDYTKTHAYHPPDNTVTCFKTQPEVMNHIELHVSQSGIEVFASDAGDPASLRSVAKSDALNLRFSRGYVSFQHAHYNAVKDNNGVLTSYHTYHWANIAFDGPAFSRPRAYEAPMPLVPGCMLTNYGSPLERCIQAGWQLTSNGLADASKAAKPITLKGVNLAQAVDAWLTFDVFAGGGSEVIQYRFNGGTWRTWNPPAVVPQAIPVMLADLKDGDNTLEMKSSSGAAIAANIELTVDVP